MDSMLDILDSFNLTDNEPENGQPNEPPKESKKGLESNYVETDKKELPQINTKGLEIAGALESNSISKGTNQSYGANTGSQTGENSSVSVSQKVLPTDTFDDWKKKYNYAGWDEFSKQFGYTPPQKQALENKQQNLKRTAMLKAFTNAASELGKVVGYEQGGMVRKKEYAPLKEIEEAKQAEAEYVKSMDAYNKKAMEYELALRDKYADYLQSMATQINTSKGQSTSQSVGESYSKGEQTNEQEGNQVTYQNAADAATDRAYKRALTKKANEEEHTRSETYGLKNGMSFAFQVGGDKTVTSRAYQAYKDKQDVFTKEEQKYLDGIVTNAPNPTENEKNENQYRYNVAATQILLNNYYETMDRYNEAIKSTDPLLRTQADTLYKELKKYGDALDYVQKTGISITPNEK